MSTLNVLWAEASKPVKGQIRRRPSTHTHQHTRTHNNNTNTDTEYIHNTHTQLRRRRHDIALPRQLAVLLL